MEAGRQGGREAGGPASWRARSTVLPSDPPRPAVCPYASAPWDLEGWASRPQYCIYIQFSPTRSGPQPRPALPAQTHRQVETEAAPAWPTGQNIERTLAGEPELTRKVKTLIERAEGRHATHLSMRGNLDDPHPTFKPLNVQSADVAGAADGAPWRQLAVRRLAVASLQGLGTKRGVDVNAYARFGSGGSRPPRSGSGSTPGTTDCQLRAKDACRTSLDLRGSAKTSGSKGRQGRYGSGR